MLIVALVHLRGLAAQGGDFALDAPASVPDFDRIAGQLRQVAFFEIDEAVGHLAESEGVGSDEVLAADAVADHERHAASRDHEPVRLLPVDYAQAVGAAQALRCRRHRLQQGAFIVFQLLVNQMRDDFGIGLGRETIAGAGQFPPQFLVIFDDAVVDQGNPAVRAMGVRVRPGDPAMGRPAGMGDAELARGAFFPHGLDQIGDLADGLDGGNALSRIVDQRHAGGIVAAIFEPLESFEQDIGDIPLRDRANYSAHAGFTVFRGVSSAKCFSGGSARPRGGRRGPGCLPSSRRRRSCRPAR